ncbi:hypothetical protein HPB48_019487 [Haemaphysalis longicornis]|uniref:Uncharacterized protein n=1 Tax=Haemaphysalis longicornis TaxID=44386 RepID=A0A9J6G8D5_HAELO|nr:hypothetical protein HPB48_019487 [Haemaphysalis longicornis]
MLRRVVSKIQGLKEREQARQSLWRERITFLAPCLLLNKGYAQLLDVIIPKAAKQDIGVYMSESWKLVCIMGRRTH